MSTINIPIGGENVPIPEWATESTLQQLTAVLDRNNTARDILYKGINNQSDDIKKLRDSIENFGNTVEETNYERSEKVSSTIRGVTQKFVRLGQRLGDTSKPLSSIVDMTGDFTKALKDGADATGASAAILEKFNKQNSALLDRLGSAAGVGGTMLLAYGGFLAAKTEQFAEAQATMIDSGAIFMDTAQRFQQMRELSYEAGVSYGALSKTINRFGKGIQALGDGVSSGSVQFARQFAILNRENDQFGDFGQTNQDMMEGFAEFIDATRMSGNMDKLLADDGAGLRASYQNMMLENSALAAATAFNRKQLVQAEIQTMTDVNFAGANQRIRNRFGDATAENLENMMSAFNTMASAEADQGGLGSEFGGRLATALQKFQLDLASGDTGARFGQHDVELLTILTSGLANGEDFINTIEQDARAGVVQDKAYYLKLFSDLEANNEQTAFANTDLGEKINNFVSSVNVMTNSNQNLANMTLEELQANRDRVAANLETTGALTETINSAASALLKAQDFITPNMQNFSEMLKNIVDGYGDSASQDSMSDRRRTNQENRNNFHSLRHNRPTDPQPLGPVEPRPTRPRLASRWDLRYGDTHNPDGTLKTPVQRALGGFLQSGAFSMVGENGPELMVTDLPAYVKTVDQIASTLGDALNSSTDDNGTTKSYYKGGYYTVLDGSGTNLFDKSGNKLYNEMSIGGLLRRTYGSGDVLDIFTAGSGDADITRTKLNGRILSTEVSSGNVNAGINSAGDAFANYKVADSLSVNATYDGETGVGSSQVNFSDGFKSALSQMSATDANARLNEMEAEFTDAAQGTPLEYVLGDFKTALNQLRRSMTHGRVKRSAEYE